MARLRSNFFPAAISLSIALVGMPAIRAANSELGRPLIRAFTRVEHKAYTQFWAPFQSEEGLMYFGNQLALMEYDGRS